MSLVKDKKGSVEQPRHVWWSCRGRRPEAFGGAAAAGDPKRLAELSSPFIKIKQFFHVPDISLYL